MKKRMAVAVILATLGVLLCGCNPQAPAPTQPVSTDIPTTTPEPTRPTGNPSCQMELDALPDGGQWTLYTEADGLLSNGVSDILVSPDGSIWFFTHDGMSRYINGEWMNYPEIKGYTEYPIDLYTVTPQGHLWMVDGENGPWMVDGEKKLWYFDGENWSIVETADEILQDEITSLATGPDGTLWGGTGESGVFHVDGDQVEIYTTADGLPEDHITGVMVTEEGVVWAGTMDGYLSRFDGERWDGEVIDTGIPGIEKIAVMDDHSIWLGGGCAFGHLQNGALTVFTSPCCGGCVSANKSAIESRDSVWVSSTWNGIFHIFAVPEAARIELNDASTSGRYFEHFMQTDGLPDNDLSAIEVDSNGGIWVGSIFGGISYYDGNGWKLYDLTATCGRVWDIEEGSDHRIWFATLGGVLSYGPSGE